MPVSLIFTIRPLASAQTSSSLGRAAHAAVLRLINDADPTLAAQIHDDDGPKPLTVSNVIGLEARNHSAHVHPDRQYRLRVTLLTPALEAIAATWRPDTLGPLDLDGVLWRVERITGDPADDPWAGSSTYEKLASAVINRSAAPSRWTFEFATPVTFRQRGLNQPLPLPALVFGSLLERWNAFAPIAFPDEARRFAEECIAVSRFNLHSRSEPTKGGVPQIGATGRVTYAAVNRDRYWLACINTLARFALFSGIGASTTRGYGQARLLDSDDR
ncbi:MAG: CRISPR-associated endoribonuclease Cas6 [Roseiflexus sp.]|nr:CRISPR-associated endoribonuclease Cas6 [Roseiflexus sp.]MDW8146398.1 CRISPR-associated endoribonuclease Cas6 [Roseiflexaceae bacterium]